MKKRSEHWTDRKWRPMMGWMYMAICILDFAIFPVLWSILQAHYKGQVTSQWIPLTLQGAGLFHLAMGAVLGVAVYSRGREKLAGMQNGSFSLPMPFEDRVVNTNQQINKSVSNGITTKRIESSPSFDLSKQVVPQGPMPEL